MLPLIRRTRLPLFHDPRHGLALRQSERRREARARIYRETGGPRWFARVKAWLVSRKY